MTRVKTKHLYLNNEKFARYNGNYTYVGQIDDYKFTRTGSSLPNYELLIKEGKSATTDLTVEARERLVDMGRLKRTWTDGREESQTWCGFMASPPNPSSSSYLAETARSIAAIKVRKKIHEESSSFSGPLFLAELRESLHQIRHPAEAAFTFLKKWARHAVAIRKKREHGLLSKRDFGDALAGSWLELAFGLEPLVADIAAIAAATLPMLEDKRLVRLVGSGVVDDAYSASQENGDFGQAMITRSHDAVWRYRHKYVVGYQREVQASNNALRQIVDLGAFTLSEIIPTAWEKLPWSFFIGYFSNINDCISADLVSLANVVWTSSSATLTYDELYHSFVIRNTMPWLSNAAFEETPLYSSRYTRISRDGAMPDFPSLRFQLPGSKKRFLNIASLATLVFPRKS